MYILGIETSCDETAASVLLFNEEEGRPGTKPVPLPRVLSNVVASQNDIHARFGGVVPELASRRHVEMIEPVVRAALEEAGLALDGVDALAVTRGPGLVVALLVGLSMAKGLAWARGLPLVGVHHLNGHIHSLYLENPPPTAGAGQLLNSLSGAFGGPPPLPHLALIVSGGHTDFYRVEQGGNVSHLGGTLDDAVGEAYDKIAAALGLGYPGGPVIDRLHAAFREREGAGAEVVPFPRPYLQDRLYHFSFSGLKTAVISYLKERDYYRSDASLPPWARTQQIPEAEVERVASGFQEAVVDVLVENVDRVVHAEGLSAVTVSGGVASNRLLRHRLAKRAAASGWSLHLPARRYCTDNAAMIACAGGFAVWRDGLDAYRRYLDMDADPSWQLTTKASPASVRAVHSPSSG